MTLGIIKYVWSKHNWEQLKHQELQGKLELVSHGQTVPATKNEKKKKEGGAKEEGSGDSEQDVVTSAKITTEPIRLQQSYNYVIHGMIFKNMPTLYFMQDWDVFCRLIASIVLFGASLRQSVQRSFLHRSHVLLRNM